MIAASAFGRSFCLADNLKAVALVSRLRLDYPWSGAKREIDANAAGLALATIG
jgi:hypothetical protein